MLGCSSGVLSWGVTLKKHKIGCKIFLPTRVFSRFNTYTFMKFQRLFPPTRLFGLHVYSVVRSNNIDFSNNNSNNIGIHKSSVNSVTKMVYKGKRTSRRKKKNENQAKRKVLVMIVISIDHPQKCTHFLSFFYKFYYLLSLKCLYIHYKPYYYNKVESNPLFMDSMMWHFCMFHDIFPSFFFFLSYSVWTEYIVVV